MPRPQPHFLGYAPQAMSLTPEARGFWNAGLLYRWAQCPSNYSLERSGFDRGTKANLFGEGANADRAADVKSPDWLSVFTSAHIPLTPFYAKCGEILLACVHQGKISIGNRKAVRCMLVVLVAGPKTGRSFSVKEPPEPASHERNGFRMLHAFHNIINDPVEMH